MTVFHESAPGRTNERSPVCPACTSPSVTTTAKRPGADTYWRCEECGEVWNVSRRHDDPRRSYR